MAGESFSIRETLDRVLYYKAKCEDLERSLEAKEKEVIDLRDQQKSSEKELTTLRGEISTLQKEKMNTAASSEEFRLNLSPVSDRNESRQQRKAGPTNTQVPVSTRSEFGGNASTSSLRSEIERLKKELKNKDELLNSPYRQSQVEEKLKKDNQQLKKELLKYKEPKKLIAEKEQEITSNSKKIAGLTGKVETLEKTISEAQSENQMLESGLKVVMEEVKVAADLNDQLQYELESSKTQAQTLKEELERGESEHSAAISELERSLAMARNSLSQANRDANKYQHSLKEASESQKQKLKDLDTQLQQMKKMISALTNFLALQNEDTTKDGTAATVIAGQMKPLIDMTEPAEQECGLNAIYNVINEKSREKIKKIEGLVPRVKSLTKSEFEYVKAAAERTMMKIESDKVYPSFGRGLDISCPYFKKCEAFKKTLNITESAWDRIYDMCYCSTCNAKRGYRLYFSRGEPPKDYGIPVGWCRFALSVPDVKADTHKIWDKWHVAFHGTTKEAISEIIKVGHLVIPGDTVIGGVRVGVRPFHIPEGTTTRYIFLSPTIRYAGMSTYASPSSFTTELGEILEARVAFQVRIKPESYQMRGETVGAKSQIDPAYLNEELEWFTNEHGSTQLYGILVKLTAKKYM